MLAAGAGSTSGVLCTLLSVATLVLFLIGFVELFTSRRYVPVGRTPAGGLLAAAVLLVIYILVC